MPNRLNRFTVSIRDKPRFILDGALTLYLLNRAPSKEDIANWPRAPNGDCILAMRTPRCASRDHLSRLGRLSVA